MKSQVVKHCLTAALACLLSSCAMLNPAIGGKTVLDLSYSDTTGATMDSEGNVITPAETIIFKNRSKLAAGVDIADAASAVVSANADGSWSMNISGNKQANTQGQADANVAISQQTIQALSAAINVLAPVLGQALDPKVQQGQLQAGTVNHAVDAAAALAPALVKPKK